MVSHKVQQPTFSASTRRFRWTLPGRVRLGKVIQVSLEHNRKINQAFGVREGDEGYKPDRFRPLARALDLSHVAIRNLAGGHIANQNDEILRGIAPYCYRVVRFEVERGDVVGVVLDYTQTYEGDWESLAAIGENGEDYDEAVVTPAQLSQDSAVEILEHLKSLSKFIPLLEEISARGKTEIRLAARQGKRMSEDESIREISRSFRAAVKAQGLETPEQLEADSAEAIAIYRLRLLGNLEIESILALYNGTRLPSVYEIESIIDAGGNLCDETGNPYTLRDLLDMIDPISPGGNDRLHHKKSRQR